MYYYYYHLPFVDMFAAKLKECLNNKSYSFERDVIVNNDNRKHIDLLITKNKIPLAIFEFKDENNLNNKNRSILFKNGVMQAKAYSYSIGVKFFFLVLSENEIYSCSISHEDQEERRQISFDDLVHYLINQEYNYQRVETDLFNSKFSSLLENEGKSLVKFLENNLLCSSDGISFIFNEDKERGFWNLLLKEPTLEGKIYRYTTLNSLFAMIDNLSYRMCGIVGMNDTSEIDYFDKYCQSKSKALTKNYSDQNKKFISSFSKHSDKLTMWRLYGDDAKGVCLEYEYYPINNNLFYTRKVSYANEEKKHPALELIKSLRQAGVIFKEIDKWKHFFKPYEFHVENEIRLLYVNDSPANGIDQKWVSTITHSIFNPIVDISLSANLLPMRLTKIILGAKCPEKFTNKYQIREMLKHKVSNKISELNLTESDPLYQFLDSIANVEIKISSIKNYR